LFLFFDCLPKTLFLWTRQSGALRSFEEVFRTYGMLAATGMTFFSRHLRKWFGSLLVTLYFCHSFLELQSHLISIQDSSMSVDLNDVVDAAVRRQERIGQSLLAGLNSTRCAINFYGLPRAFRSLVLPSIVKNIILPNARYGCDYYIHYYEQREEAAGRSGGGGTINPDEILLLREEVEMVARSMGHSQKPTVSFTKDREEEFWRQYADLIEKVRNTKDANGKYVYFPEREKTYVYPTTTDNIIKMWHSVQASWTLMEESAKRNGFEYSRVAMLRSDVVYMTPIDIFGLGPGRIDTGNKHAVIPAFSKYPICDRIIYGPAPAVKVWATQRFDRIDSHVQWTRTLKNMTGFGIQPERFVKYALFPDIRKLGTKVIEHPTMCFFRARSDETVWVSDCSRNASPNVKRRLPKDKKAAVERVIGRSCGTITVARKPYVESLNCSLAFVHPHVAQA